MWKISKYIFSVNYPLMEKFNRHQLCHLTACGVRGVDDTCKFMPRAGGSLTEENWFPLSEGCMKQMEAFPDTILLQSFTDLLICLLSFLC